jgi:predicted RNase H-like HicB family nuclease
MNTNYTAVVKEEAGWWIGWIEEVPGVNCQEETRDALLESLRVTLREALQFNRSDALEAAGNNYEELELGVWSAAIWFGTSNHQVVNYFGKAAVIRGGITLRRT